MKFRVVGGTDSGLNSPEAIQAPDRRSGAEERQGNERRRAVRQGANTKVILHHPELLEEACATRDLSESGAFVLMPNAACLSRGTVLDVTFVVQQKEVTKLHNLTAIVAQIRSDGVGLKLLPGKRYASGPAPGIS